MDEYMKESLEIAKAQAKVRNMTEDEIASLVQNLANSLRNLEAGKPAEGSRQHQEPAVDPKKAIREKSVICLECGASFKLLSKKHLAQHELTPQEYKEKWGFKSNQALVAKSLSRKRRQKMQEMELWKRRGVVKA
ncbi:MAG: MucR family transcriptional regulator [Desulfohalobiaceae bacterium]